MTAPLIDLEAGHPHLQQHAPHSGKTHAHASRIDTLPQKLAYRSGELSRRGFSA